jgi:8-oxo-dGTP diphosphatase
MILNGYYVVNVEAAIYNDDKWLIVKRKKQEGHASGSLALVGGKVEVLCSSDNGLEETLKREVMEEIGAEVEDIDYLESKTLRTDEGQIEVHIVLVCRLRSRVYGCPGKDGIAEVYWLTAREVIRNHNAPWYLRQSIARAEEKRLSKQNPWLRYPVNTI